MNYIWNPKIQGLMKGDADTVGHELETLEEVTPENVLAYANENRDSELAKNFTWDRDEAAFKWNLLEARRVIQFIMVAPETKQEQPTRVFQISSERNVYKPVIFFKQNKSEYDRLLERAKQELLTIKERFKTLSELEVVFEAIDEVV